MFDGTPSAQPVSYRPPGSRDGPSIAWVCIGTRPRQEAFAGCYLRRLGLCVWLPQHFARDKIRALFPTYLFCQVDFHDGKWPSIYRTPYVARVVGSYHERPAVVPVEALELLWRDCASDGVLWPKAPQPPREPLRTIAPGAPLTVTAGAFAELQGICLRSSADRVKILLTIMGRAVPVTMARAAVA